MSNASAPLHSILADAVSAGASDLILIVGAKPSVYVKNRLQSLSDTVLTSDQVEQQLREFLTHEQFEQLRQNRDLDLAMELPGSSLCRVNLHYQKQSLAAAFRFIPGKIPTLEELGLPEMLYQIAQRPHGLCLITGPTGHGKSTTLAAIVDYINRTFARHIITLEDPIEFSFTHDKSIIEQREIGRDTTTFASGLRHILRQKPDVILIGEMRDCETMSAALTAAETGHLVLSTLHTRSAAHAIERIVDSFDGARQQQIRIQLAHTLEAVVSQMLIPDASDEGLIPACEVMMTNSAIRRAIRDNEIHLIPGIIETGARFGMQTIGQSIRQWASSGRITKEEALMHLDQVKLIDGDTGQALADAVSSKPSVRGTR